MVWTESYGRRADAWPEPESRRRTVSQPPLERYRERVDRLFYVSVAALAVCIIGLIVR